MRFAKLRDAPELTARGILGLFGRHILPHEPFRKGAEMFFDFGVQLAVRFLVDEYSAESGGENAKPRHVSPTRCQIEHTAHGAGNPSPVLGLAAKLFAARRFDGVELGLTIVLRCAPDC